MKRASTKKVKAVSACAAGNDALEGQFKSIQPKVRRRVRTSVAMIGLTISMGAPNLLLTRQSDRAPAVEPVGNELTVSTGTAATVSDLGGSMSSVEPEAVKSLPAGSSDSTVVPANPGMQLEAAVSKPAPPVVEHDVQEAASDSLVRNRQAGVLKTLPENRIVHIKAGKTVETFSKSDELNRSQITPLAVTSGDQRLNVEESREVTDEVNTLLKAKQRILINRLKQTSTRSQHSLAELRSEKSNNLSAPATTSVEPPSEVSALSTAKQRVLINRLKQKSNPLQDSLAELRSEESNNLSAPATTTSAAPSSSVEQALTINPASLAPLAVGSVGQQVPVEGITSQGRGDLLPEVTTSNESAVLDAQKLQQTPSTTGVVPDVPNSQVPTTHPATVRAAPLSPESNESAVFDLEKSQEMPSATGVVPDVANSQVPTTNLATVGQQELVGEGVEGKEVNPPSTSSSNWRTVPLSPEVATSNESAILDAQKSQQTPVTAVVVPNMPKSVSEPTVVVATVSPVYQVRAGDTLTAIARNYGISLSELIKTNQLSNPDQLEINQRLRIPVLQTSSAVGQTIAVIERSTHPETTSSVAVATLETASSNPTLPVVLPSSPLSANNSSVSIPSMPVTGELQPNAKLIVHNQGGSQQESASVPPEPLAGKPSVNATFHGVGGSILDETDQLSSPTVGESQLESTAAKSEPQSNLYVQSLQTDIQRLRQKYYAQQTVSQVVPKANPQLRPNRPANQPINPEFRSEQAKDSNPVQARARVATAPMDINPSEPLESFRGRQQVSPELPPLAPVDNYLPKPSPSSVPFKKGYVWPTKGVLTSGYGYRWGRMHKGIDIAAPMGTPIVAAAPGFVVRAGWNSGGYGNLVDILHADGSLTRYAHNKRILVQRGQEVKQGQQISAMGSTGYSTGPHLHFEVHPVGKKGAVNPIAFLPR